MFVEPGGVSYMDSGELNGDPRQQCEPYVAIHPDRAPRGTVEARFKPFSIQPLSDPI